MQQGGNRNTAKLLMERSIANRVGAIIPDSDVPVQELPETNLLRSNLELPEVSEPEVVQYFTGLSHKNFSIDTHFYPLGSCTMKYNPKINDEVAFLPGFANIHPLQDDSVSQGALSLMHELQSYLQEITGMDCVGLSTLAGAHGEFAGMLMIRAFHQKNKDANRTKVAIPDSAHGTNPASAAMSGFDVISIPSDEAGNIDIDFLKSIAGPDLAGAMITLPSTLGIFDTNITEVCKIVHEAGGLVYGDGANMNALLGRAKLGHLGFDVIHLNLHKTFSTPHGGGGPGAGPVCAKSILYDFLPAPVVEKSPSAFELITPASSIGRISGFQGNFAVLVRAYTYIKTLGAAGIKSISGNAVLNANYIMESLKDIYDIPYNRTCMHEVVFSASSKKDQEVNGLAIAKRLLDYGFHAPTMYFPLIVEEALMVEPTESETLETLDAFIDAMKAINEEISTQPELVTEAPHTTPVSKLDEAKAAREPQLKWEPS